HGLESTSHQANERADKRDYRIEFCLFRPFVLLAAGIQRDRPGHDGLRNRISCDCAHEEYLGHTVSPREEPERRRTASAQLCTAMKIYPAIDILGGQAVRLKQGRKDQATVYGDPIEMATKWVKKGAEWLHIVDLDGAFEGEPKNLDVLRDIATAVPNAKI